MRKIAAKLLLNWLPSAVASFIGGLALDFYLHSRVAPSPSPTSEIVSVAAIPTAIARPNDVQATASETAPSSALPASPGPVRGKSAAQRSPSTAATRSRPSTSAFAIDPAARGNIKPIAGSRSTAQEPINGAPVPEGVTVVEEPSLSLGATAPQPFSIAEFKQRLAGALTTRTAWLEPPCDDRFDPFTHKRCTLKKLEASGVRTWP